MASTGTGCFVVSYRFFSGGSNRQSLSAHLTMGGHGGVRYQPVIYNFENYEFCGGEYIARVSNYGGFLRMKREGATFIQDNRFAIKLQICFQPVVLSSDRIIVQRMKNSFRLDGLIYYGFILNPTRKR